MEWRVFFIGPMNTPMKRNLPRLRRVFLNHLIRKRGYAFAPDSKQTVVQGEDRITAIIPQDNDLAGSPITDGVFHQIDNADLVVADLSGGRAAVVYELAMAHALGVYTALVNNRDKDLMFYLKDYQAVKINLSDRRFDSATALPPPKVGAAIDRWLEVRASIRSFENPFTKFYGAPLYDISAASGLAAGFFLNFAEPILLSGKIGFTQDATPSENRPQSPVFREIRGLIVFRPRQLTESIPQIEKALEEILMREFGSDRISSGTRKDLIIKTDKGPRTVFYAVDDFVIDIPRTVFSLRQCYRMQRLQRMESRITAAETWSDDQLSVNMQEILIERFFEDLRLRVLTEQKRHEDKYAFGAMTDKYHVGTLDEIPKIIRTGRSRTFSNNIPTEWSDN